MTHDQIEEYRKTAKIGDRLTYRNYSTVHYVRGVEDRGVVMSLREKTADHQFLSEWSWLNNYSVVHKEA